MDVSRIEAISPKQIDWRKLTAPEIIEYKEQGIDVPSQYLQWAQSFLADVNAADTDETTYEAANSQTTTPAAESAATTTVAEGEEGVEVQEEPKTEAQAKREDMEQGGASLSEIAKTFIGASVSARGETLESAALMSATARQSDNEIQSLDNHMKELLAKAEQIQSELKNEVDSVNDGENDPSAIAKINRLNAQLQRMGTEGQANVAGVEGDLNVYESTISSQSSIILNAQDFGTETIGVGQDLLASIRGHFLFNLRDFVLGHRAERTGERAVDVSEIATEVQNDASNRNSDNLSKAQDYKTQIEAKTGVAGIDVNKENEENKNDPANPENQTKDAASADLDQILKAKIRKGENVGNDQLS
ncbi:hypothetical protein J6A64_00660 [bacterium]|nr:hypothetical protein [bacterium]